MLSRSIRKTVSSVYSNYRFSSTLALKECLNKIDAHNSEINAFVSLNDRTALEQQAMASDQRQENGTRKSKLDGAIIAIKDNICTSSLPTTCASNMLKDFSSPYDATVVRLLQEAGGLMIGKTNMDEFGMGSANVHSAFGPVINPSYKQEKRVAGGSSGGSAASVAMGMSKIALGSDTGGSIRMPASYCGVIGYKPSYGRISRHGLIAYANSLDTVGILTKDIQDCIDTYEILSKYDEKDPTSIPNKLRNELDDNATQMILKYKDNLNGLVVGVPQEYYVDSLSTEVLNVWRQGIKKLQDLGAKIVPVSIPHISLSLPAYYIIALAEASSNLGRYDGIRFGHRSPDNIEKVEELLYTNTRSTGFGDEVKRRILLGTHVLTAGTYETLFLPAQSARRLIQQEFDSVFNQSNSLSKKEESKQQGGAAADVLIVPSATSSAPLLNQKTRGIEEYINDVMTLPANLTGIPAITLPFHQQIGLQLVTQYGYDAFLLHLSKIICSAK